jgi:hypothetical protein
MLFQYIIKWFAFHSPHPTLVMQSKYVVHRVMLWKWRNDTTDSSWRRRGHRPITAKLTARAPSNNIEALMLRDNLFFRSFVQYSATIKMESNIKVQVRAAPHHDLTKSEWTFFHFRSILLFSAKISSRRPFSFNLMVQEAQP